MSHSVTEINDTNFKDFLGKKDVAIVDVFASWCGSCRLFAPVFNEAATAHADFAFYKIDGEKNPDFAALLEIDNLPFVAVFHKGEYVGGQSTSKKEALESMIATIKERTT